MAEYGISTWDANGKYNNYGIKPVTVLGVIKLSAGQTSGSWSFNVPNGFKIGYVIALDKGAFNSSNLKRKFTLSRNTISISQTSEWGANIYSQSECEVVVFVEVA